jgi:hypothetical protein
MSRLALRDRDRTALRRGAMLLLPALAYVWAAKPFLRDLAGTNERLASERALLSQELQLLSVANRYPRALAESERALAEWAPKLFDGPDEMSASANVAYYVSDEARQARVVVRQMETQKAEAAGDGLTAFPVTLRAESDLEGVMTLLRAVETGGKLVRVEELSIERAATAYGMPGAMAMAPGGETEALTVTIRARGFGPARPDTTTRPGVRARHR